MIPDESSRPIRVAAVAASVLACAVAAAAQAPAPARSTRTAAHVSYLASPKLEGRLTGSPGADAAAEYIERELQRIGAKPLPGLDGYRVPFSFTSGVADEGSSIEWTQGSGAPNRHADPKKIVALSFSDAATVSGPAVFAGYGLRVPGESGMLYDSYAGLDVKDKVVIVLRYFPEDADRELRQQLARYSGLRYKALAARQQGAKALVVVTGPRSMNAGELVPLTLDTAAAGSGIVAASISGDVAAELFAGTGRSLDEVQKALDTGNPHVTGFDLKDTTITVSARVARKSSTTWNIVGWLPATGEPKKDKPYLMLGAHYDHLGRGAQGTSLARAEERDRVHPGGDDNASGVAAVLTAGAQLATMPRSRHVVLAFWSGEEIGLVGSGAFVSKPPFPLDQLAAYLNFDMVGRLRQNRLNVQATGSSPAWPSIVERANGDLELTLTLQSDPHLPTDSSSFNQAGVPTLAFFTGSHEDYHRPSDVAERVDVDGIDRIVSLAVKVTQALLEADEPPAFTRVEQTTQGRGAREGLRLFTGTIPDYSAEVSGLLLGGVVPGGPAEQAGLQKGDVIVELAGQKITNIYDYTYALDVMKPDQPVKVVYLRNGERREAMLTPRVRK
ncbi:MAG TPA: M20/M25/M40 family metallo-hydrolase [Vicinamibacterales bacterium]